MGFFRNLMGREQLPPLPDDSYAVERINKVLPELRQLIAETNDRIEVVPAEESAYVFIGKPPRKFGVAWIRGGEVTNLGEVARQRNFSPITLERIEDDLGAAYRRSEPDQRYQYEMNGQEVVVTPSEDLETEVDRIIQELLK